MEQFAKLEIAAKDIGWVENRNISILTPIVAAGNGSLIQMMRHRTCVYFTMDNAEFVRFVRTHNMRPFTLGIAEVDVEHILDAVEDR